MRMMAENTINLTEMSPRSFLGSSPTSEEEEEFTGHGEVNIISTSARKTASFLSRIITEKDWYDDLFAAFDFDDCGKIKVSKLMEGIKFNSEGGDFDDLAEMLDPLGHDILIDVETVRAIMIAWESKQITSAYSSGIFSDCSYPSPRECIQSLDFTDTNFSQDDYKMTTETLEHDNAQLKFINRKLMNENSRLEVQVASLEDKNNCLRNEVDCTQNRLQSLQNSLQECQDEYHSLLSNSEEEMSNVRKELLQLNEERNALETQSKTLSRELSGAKEELKNHRNQEETLKQTILEEEKIALSKLQELEEQLSQKCEECLQFKRVLLELLSSNEELRVERRQLEEDMHQLYEKQCLEVSMKNTEEIDPVHEKEPEVSPQSDLDVTLDNILPPIETPSTPDEHDSIYYELMHSLSEDSDTRQPLCGKFPEMIVSKNAELHESCDSDDNLISLRSILAEFDERLDSVHTESLEKYHIPEGKFHKPKSSVSTASQPSLTVASTDSIQDQISKEIKMLRLQIARSEVVLASLQSKSSNNKMHSFQEVLKVDRKRLPFPSHLLFGLDGPFDELNHDNASHWTAHQNAFLYNHPKNFHRCYTHAVPSSSHSSTPQHCRLRSHSCPILPSQTSYVTKGTQTEPLDMFPATEIQLVTATEGKPTHFNGNASSSQKNPKSSTPLNMAQILLHHPPSVSTASDRENITSSEDDNSVSSSPVVLTLRNRSYSFAQAIAQAIQQGTDADVWESSSGKDINQLEHQSSFETISTTSIHEFMVTASIEETEEFRSQPEETEASKPHKKTNTPDISSDRERKSGLSTVCKEPPKMVVSIEHHSGHQDHLDDDSEDDGGRRTLSRIGSRRRRRSFGSPASSPAIQRSKAVDFDFDVTDDKLYSLTDKMSTNKDDSDLDVKRDILAGMTLATSYTSRQSSATDTSTSGTTTPSTVSASATRCPLDATESKLRRRPGDSTKSRLLMPDLMENSETESAKNSGGSMESEAEPPATGNAATDSTIIMPPHPVGDGPFPSLPDSYLKKMQLSTSSSERPGHLSDQEIESKFNSLCLAFKTDRFTLTSRLELHQRQRDLAEKNVDDEITAIKENLNVLSQICSDEETRDLVKQLHRHLEVLNQSTSRMSSRAEVYGAVQQEERTNRAIEVMLMYVENLKRYHDKHIQEIEELRRILSENNLLPEEANESEEGRRAIRTYSLSAVGIGKPQSRRRASIATLHRPADKLDGKTKFANLVANAASRNSTCKIDTRRCTQVYNTRPFSTLDRSHIADKTRKLSNDDLHLASSSVEQNNNENLFYDGNEPSQTILTSKAEISSLKLRSLPEASTANKDVKTVSSISNSGHNLPLKIASTIEDGDEGNCDLYATDEHGSDISPPAHNIRNFTWPKAQLIHRAHYLAHSDEQEGEDEEDEHRTVPNTLQSLISQHSSTRSTVLSLPNLKHWMHNSSHFISSLRYAVGGLLFLAALCSLLFTFLPSSTSAAVQCHPRTWYSIEELLRSRLELTHQTRPPT